jgi:RNA polymerase sigma factor (sigma-70 family)
MKSESDRSLDAAFSSFCSEEYPKLVGSLSLICRSIHEVEDIAQEALARTYRDWKKVQNLGSPSAWTHRVAINLARSRYRRLRVQLRYRYKLSQEQSAEHVEQEPLATLAFKDLVADLPPRQKSALVLRYFLCLSVREVAYVMDCSEGTAKSLIHKAISSLRRSAAKETTSTREGVPNAIRSR